jgi:hypothetical protein
VTPFLSRQHPSVARSVPAPSRVPAGAGTGAVLRAPAPHKAPRLADPSVPGPPVPEGGLAGKSVPHYCKDLSGAPAVVRLIEKVEASDEETQVDFMAAMDAAMTGRSKKEILEDFRRAREAAEEDPDGEGTPTPTTKPGLLLWPTAFRGPR